MEKIFHSACLEHTISVVSKSHSHAPK